MWSDPLFFFGWATNFMSLWRERDHDALIVDSDFMSNAVHNYSLNNILCIFTLFHSIYKPVIHIHIYSCLYK